MEKRICQYCGRDEECDLEQDCPLATPPRVAANEPEASAQDE